MRNKLLRAIVLSLLRRGLGYLGIGVAMLPSLTDSIISDAGVVLAGVTAAWSIADKVRDARRQ